MKSCFADLFNRDRARSRETGSASVSKLVRIGTVSKELAEAGVNCREVESDLLEV